jgi:RecB family endonuclease NucS
MREKDILEELGLNGRMCIRVGVCEVDYQAQEMVSDRNV